MLKANYHTHSAWCKHASGTFEDYIKEAINADFEEIAITDHCPHKYSWSWLREDEVPALDKELNETIDIYKDKIKIYKGFECEYIREEMEYFKYLKEELGYSFMILGQHCSGEGQAVNSFYLKTPSELRTYADWVCEGLETNFFMLLAHPDVIFTEYPNKWDRDCEKAFDQIFKTCEKMKMPVEINVNGMRGDRGYPSKEMLLFSKDYNLKYLINTDAHDPKHIYDDWAAKAEKWVAELGIVPELIYPWEDRK